MATNTASPTSIAEIFALDTTSTVTTGATYYKRTGFDLALRQEVLAKQMEKLEIGIKELEDDASLSDTEKMFQMQMSLNAWSAISNLRTNMLKTVADTLKTIVRNVA